MMKLGFAAQQPTTQRVAGNELVSPWWHIQEPRGSLYVFGTHKVSWNRVSSLPRLDIPCSILDIQFPSFRTRLWVKDRAKPRTDHHTQS